MIVSTLAHSFISQGMSRSCVTARERVCQQTKIRILFFCQEEKKLNGRSTRHATDGDMQTRMPMSYLFHSNPFFSLSSFFISSLPLSCAYFKVSRFHYFFLNEP